MKEDEILALFSLNEWRKFLLDFFFCSTNELPEVKKRISWNFVAASDIVFLLALSSNRVTNAVIRWVWNGAQQIKNAITTATRPKKTIQF